MKKLSLSALLLFILSLAHGQETDQKYTPQEIYQKASYVCRAETIFEIIGVDSGGSEVQLSLGDGASCFAVTYNGQKIILTNAHLSQPLIGEINYEVQSPTGTTQGKLQSIKSVRNLMTLVTFKNSENQYLIAEFQDIDEEKDLAKLRLKKQKDYERLPTGILSPSKKIQVGDRVFNIGNPLGHKFAFHTGYISLILPPSADEPYRAIITEEMTGPGNSGSPLINESGEVIGINRMYMVINPHFSRFIHVDEIKKYLEKTEK